MDLRFATSTAPLLEVVPSLHELIRWSVAVPDELVDVYGLELELGALALSDPPAVHLRVRRERAELLTGPGLIERLTPPDGEALTRVRDLVDHDLDGGERGFVVEWAGDTYGLGAIYTSLLRKRAYGTTLVREVLECLGADGDTVELTSRFPREVIPSHIGVMPSRPQSPTRLVFNLNNLSSDALFKTLSEQPHAPHDNLAAAASLARSFTDGTVYINIDTVGGALGPNVGVEYKPPDSDQGSSERTQRLAEWLAAADACSPTELATMLAWQGRSFVTNHGGPASDLELRSLVSGEGGTLEERRINHFKVTLGPAGIRTVKAYLFAYQLEAELATSKHEAWAGSTADQTDSESRS